MKKITITLIGITLLSAASYADHHETVDIPLLKSEAISIIKKFGGTLKPQLKSALKSGGAVNAVSVCAVVAPKIAKQINNENKDWSVRRISLKNRNPNMVLDAWESAKLKEFDQRVANGEKANKMFAAEVVDGKFRFLKAQGTAKVCLACHGKNISAEVKKKIQMHYPHDKATGYSLGQVRGAFSLSKTLK
ncbi:Cytochrome c family protein [uncultured Gammaproteobacteria bacterium]|jgi:cytochrome c553|nr:Cytochrome c family protein [uncultured Gammaproteobacteria bacterium]CAC9583430.1 Cytochrome c family protein [uncultured Gammaproteobacteria bacterium]CAC9646758.1 Cytochrome c family protein [uncultured Gammaproteobacteria bacterium]CAC9981344.1 Cytochrome c family protein [uncultured Gammaproteobacteria bacterium]CAC9992024.1 Cytochrome c family protein [uncultured Gammaproteobacteria bacterium]